MASPHLVNGILLTHVFWGGTCPRTFFCFFGVRLPLCLKGEGNTALMKASANGHTATAELLLGAGADKEAKDKVREEKNHTHKWLSRWFDGGTTVWPLFTS